MRLEFRELAAIRLGFGLSKEIESPSNLETILMSVTQAGPTPEAMTTERAMEYTSSVRVAAKLYKEYGEPQRYRYEALRKEFSPLVDLRRRIGRALEAPSGFGERLVQFWSDHFTIRAMSPSRWALALAFQDEAIRPHVNGRFEDLFFAADTHPMMLIYLDQISSRGPSSQFVRQRPAENFGLNENLAREALELHSIGVDAAYTQRDVRALAKLLTGLTFSQKRGFLYNTSWAEPGAVTVLGRRYREENNGLDDVRAVLYDIARRPETARYISRKLAVHFYSNTPSEDLVESLTAVWLETGGDLSAVYRVLVCHSDLAATFGQKVRQPFDLNVAALRALGVNGARIARLDFPEFRGTIARHMSAMGQPWGQPGGPDGWPEETDAWITPQSLAARINWASQMPGQILDELPDPRAMLDWTFAGAPSEQLAWAVPKAETTREGIALILASSDFNRR